MLSARSVPKAARTCSAIGGCDLGADDAAARDERGVNIQQTDLGLVVIGDDAAGEHGRRARHIREQVAEQTAGAAVGHGDGLVLREQELGRARLDIRRVNAVGKGAELALHARHARGDHGLGLGLRGGLGRDAHEALALLGIGCEGGVLHLVHEIAQLVLHRTLPDAEDLDAVRDDDPVPARGEQRAHTIAQQRLTLQRRAGQHDDKAAVRLERAGRAVPQSFCSTVQPRGSMTCCR